jgi:hypothetical protein
MIACFRLVPCVVAVLAISLLCCSAKGRPVRIWSEEELFEQADLVVLVKAAGTKEVPVMRKKPIKPDAWIEVETTFDMQSVLKGEAAKKPLGVRHNKYYGKEGEFAVIDGPSFVEFDAKKPRQYLAFLKAVKVDGEVAYYEPLTGQYDPDGSFFAVERYHISKEREKPADATSSDN